MKVLFNIFILAIFAAIASCNHPVNPNAVCFGKETSIEEGKTALYKTCPSNGIKPELTIKFTDLIEDNRCAEGVVCVWEGEAIVEFSLDHGKEKIKLSTYQPKFAEYNGHTIELVSVNRPKEGQAYKATILVR